MFSSLMSVPMGICTNSGHSLRSMGPENLLALWLLLLWSVTQGDQTLVLFIKHLVKEKNGRIRLIIWSSVRSPEKVRLQVSFWLVLEITVDAGVFARNNTERALVHGAWSPQWKCFTKPVVGI